MRRPSGRASVSSDEDAAEPQVHDERGDEGTRRHGVRLDHRAGTCGCRCRWAGFTRTPHSGVKPGERRDSRSRSRGSPRRRRRRGRGRRSPCVSAPTLADEFVHRTCPREVGAPQEREDLVHEDLLVPRRPPPQPGREQRRSRRAGPARARRSSPSCSRRRRSQWMRGQQPAGSLGRRRRPGPRRGGPARSRRSSGSAAGASGARSRRAAPATALQVTQVLTRPPCEIRSMASGTGSSLEADVTSRYQETGSSRGDPACGRPAGGSRSAGRGRRRGPGRPWPRVRSRGPPPTARAAMRRPRPARASLDGRRHARQGRSHHHQVLRPEAARRSAVVRISRYWSHRRTASARTAGSVASSTILA